MSGLNWQRAVIKVGSALIAPDGDQCSGQYLLPMAHFINACRAQGKEVILVSSGSVAAGRSYIKHQHKPSIAEKQAMAAIGQTRMLANWARFFDFPCAQILLTADDLRDRTRYVNIQNTLRELLANKALPIINENDSVAVNELKVGDNDNLAAYTALVCQADTLIICSDVDGLFNADPRNQIHAQLIKTVTQVDNHTMALASGAGSSVGTGGMLTKLQAAQKCMDSGIDTLIVNGRKAQTFETLLAGDNPGTHFLPAISHQRAKAKWLKHTLGSQGNVEVDSGAKQALTNKGASLLPIGIVGINGEFNAGDAVDITHQGHTFAKGLSLYSAVDLGKIQGQHSNEVYHLLGYSVGEAAVHRDNLVLLHSEQDNS